MFSMMTLSSLCLLACLHLGATASNPRRLFESAEHLDLGSHVNLPPPFSSRAASVVVLPHLNLTFADIVPLAGDCFGVPTEPICFANSTEDAVRRFLAAFATLSSSKRNTTGAYVRSFRDTVRAIKQHISEGKSAHSLYDDKGEEFNKLYNVISGGGSAVSDYLPEGLYLELAETNYDHFSSGNCSWIAYKTGHDLAVRSFRQGDRKQMLLGLAYEAFALHFLSDAFAAGHERTPRVDFEPGALGGLLARYIHNEDNRLGVNLENDAGDHWLAFGDGAYFDSYDSTNRRLAAECMQASVSSLVAGDPLAAVRKLWPRVSSSGQAANNGTTPLFAVRVQNGTKVLLRREELNDPWSKAMTEDWWPATTLTELELDYNAPLGPEDFTTPTTTAAAAASSASDIIIV